jgi:hypothetical protein
VGNRRRLCPRCRVDLTDRLRGHLYNCARLPGAVRHRAREARAAAQRLVKHSQQNIDRADVLARESETLISERNLLINEARAALDALRETMRRIAGA